MATEEGLELETLLNKATNALNREVDWQAIVTFCEQVNKELEGPQIAVRLLAHKFQSPQDREAIYALNTLETCVKYCGRRFHQEIGKFRFLNELIKVVSPKYLGTMTSAKVKAKCIELLYSWSTGLSHEAKIKEAYDMLKKQGIVLQDPVHVDQTIEVPPPRERNSIFDDNEKSKLLSRLLRSKHPEDLQAANRLIKNMVRQDAEKTEQVSRRIQHLDTVYNNVKLLGEMLAHYQPGETGESDVEIMKELYDNLERQRPNLFKLASDSDDSDGKGLTEILQANDEMMRVMNLYKQLIEGKTPSASASGQDARALLDLGGGPSAQKSTSSLLDDNLLGLGLNGVDSSGGAGAQVNTQSDLDQLGDIFGASTKQHVPTTNSSGLLDLMSGPDLVQASGPASNSLPNLLSGISGPPSYLNPSLPPYPSSLSSVRPQHNNYMGSSAPMSSINSSVFSSTAVTGILSVPTQASGSRAPAQQHKQSTKVLSDIDLLSQDLLQKTLTSASAKAGRASPNLPKATGGSLIMGCPGSPSHLAGDVKPLTDIFVSLDTIKPGQVSPLTAYDKCDLKVVLHFGKDTPREDVLVTVVSVMSTSSHPIKNFQFQAAVPKSMKVKLQPSSASDLPAFNPILPPAAITQVMLIANPQKERIRLKFKVMYNQEGQQNSDVGELMGFPDQQDLA